MVHSQINPIVCFFLNEINERVQIYGLIVHRVTMNWNWNWNQHLVIYLLKIKFVILLQVVLQWHQVVTLHNHDQLQVMVSMVWMQYVCPANLLNQEMIVHTCIKVDITQHLTDMDGIRIQNIINQY